MSIPDRVSDSELTLEFTHCYGGYMSLSNWRIGRALGIPIHVHASWLVVFFFMTWSLATGYLPEMLPGLSSARYWGMGGVAALLLFLSVLLHELGHSYVALRYQIPINQITLFIFGGMAHMGKEPPSPRAEFLIAMAGPLVSLLLGAGCLGGAVAVDSLSAGSGFQGLAVLGGLLGVVNVQLGLFNLIPGFPLDGGRVLRAGLWAWNKDFHRATSQAALTGIGFGVGLGLTGAVLMENLMPVFASDDWIALIMLSVTVEPDCDSTCISNLVPLAMPAPHCAGSVHVMTPPCSLQPWPVSSSRAAEVENG